MTANDPPPPPAGGERGADPSGQAGPLDARSPDARSSGAKSPDALQTIGELAEALGIRQHVLRYWEDQFPMLRPLKRSGGRRYYRAADVALVQTIHRLVHREGYTLRGARQVLEGKPAKPAAAAAPAPQAPPQPGPTGSHLHTLRMIRAKLAAALDA